MVWGVWTALVLTLPASSTGSVCGLELWNHWSRSTLCAQVRAFSPHKKGIQQNFAPETDPELFLLFFFFFDTAEKKIDFFHLGSDFLPPIYTWNLHWKILQLG